MENIFQRLRAAGCRITPQRVAILRAVLEDEAHPTIEGIYAQVKAEYPMTSRATIYNTVSLLKEMGAVLEIGLAHGGSRYDGINPQPHPHLICTQCNTIVDADSPALSFIETSMQQETGFKILSHRLDFFGLCPQCQAGG